MSQTKLWTLKELMAYLDISHTTAWRLLTFGKIRGFKVGGMWRFKPEDVEAYLAGCSNVGKTVGNALEARGMCRHPLNSSDANAQLDRIMREAKGKHRGT